MILLALPASNRSSKLCTWISSLPLLCLHSSASLLEKWEGNLKILLSGQTIIYISVDIQFKALKFDTHMQDIFVWVVKRFEVVCTSNLETAHNLMSLGWICSPLIQNRVNAMNRWHDGNPCLVKCDVYKMHVKSSWI